MTHPRVGLFALWSAARAADRIQLNQVFVHSKVVAIDDCWATAGSANLDGASLHSYGDDFTGIGRRVFRHTRNFDVNVVVEGASAGALRSRLWSEHLRSPPCRLRRPPGAGMARAVARASGGQRRRAERAVKDAARLRPALQRRAHPGATAGRSGRARRPAASRLRFDPGWLEVHFSPNWVRNMFHEGTPGATRSERLQCPRRRCALSVPRRERTGGA